MKLNGLYTTIGLFTILNLAMPTLSHSALSNTPKRLERETFTQSAVSAEQKKVERERTKEEIMLGCVKDVYKALIMSSKTGNTLESSLEKLGTSSENIVKGYGLLEEGLSIKDAFELIRNEFKMPLEGKKCYVVKQVVYPKEFLEDYVKAIISKSGDDFETIVLPASDYEGAIKIGYYKPKKGMPECQASINVGLKVQLIRADSRDEALEKVKDPQYKPIFSATNVTTTKEMKLFDNIFTAAIKCPSDQTIDHVLEVYGVN